MAYRRLADIGPSTQDAYETVAIALRPQWEESCSSPTEVSDGCGCDCSVYLQFCRAHPCCTSFPFALGEGIVRCKSNSAQCAGSVLGSSQLNAMIRAVRATITLTSAAYRFPSMMNYHMNREASFAYSYLLTACPECRKDLAGRGQR